MLLGGGAAGAGLLLETGGLGLLLAGRGAGGLGLRLGLVGVGLVLVQRVGLRRGLGAQLPARTRAFSLLFFCEITTTTATMASRATTMTIRTMMASNDMGSPWLVART